MWQICEHHHTLGLFPAIFIISTTGIYAGVVESISNLPFYFHKINFNAILPSIFGLNIPKSFFSSGFQRKFCTHFIVTKKNYFSPTFSSYRCLLLSFLKHILQWNVYYFSSQQVMFLHFVGVLPSTVEFRFVNKLTPTLEDGEKADGIMKLSEIFTSYKFYVDLDFIHWVSPLTWKNLLGFKPRQ